MILSFFEVGASTVSSEIWSEFSTVLSSSSSRERLDSDELGVAETSKISQLFSEQYVYKPEIKSFGIFLWRSLSFLHWMTTTIRIALSCFLGQENINPFSYKS